RGHVDLRQAVEQIPYVLARRNGGPRPQHGVLVQDDAGHPWCIEGQDNPRVPLDVAQLDLPGHMTRNEIIAVQPDPDDGDLRAPVGVDGAQVSHGAGRDQVSQFTRQTVHSVIASVTSSSYQRNVAVRESARALGEAFQTPEFYDALAHCPDSAVAAPHVFEKVAVPGSPTHLCDLGR